MPWSGKESQQASQGPPVPRLPPSLEAHFRIKTAVGINYAAGLLSISPTILSLLKSSYRSQEEYGIMQWLAKSTLPLTNWATLVKFLHFPVLQFPW